MNIEFIVGVMVGGLLVAGGWLILLSKTARYLGAEQRSIAYRRIGVVVILMALIIAFVSRWFVYNQ